MKGIKIMLSAIFSSSSNGDSFSNNIPMIIFTVLFLSIMTIAVLWSIVGTYRAEKNPMSRTLNNNKRNVNLHLP